MKIFDIIQIQKQTNIFFKLGARMLIFLTLFLLPNQSFAVTQQDLDQKNQELQNAKNALNSTQAQRLTLQGEVSNFNNQIQSLESKINSTESEIFRLNKEIIATNDRIKEAEMELTKTKGELSEIIRTTYEEGQISDVELIAKSKSFSEFVNKTEYIETLQLKITEVVNKVIALKKELETKKNNLETSKQKTEDLRNQQVAQQNEVSSQKSAKDILLQRTKGDEAAYQALVKKIQSDYSKLQSQLWGGGGNYVSLGHVEAGDIIGYIGNSGYSTGCHLHFEIRSSSQGHLNPFSYIGDGYFINPAPGVWVSAPYGYSSAYFPGVFHTGVDFADGCAGKPIRATGPGEIIQRVSGRPNTYDWSLEYGNYVKIKHTNGMYSLYGHMR